MAKAKFERTKPHCKPAKSDYIAFPSYLQGKSQKNNTFRLCSL